MHEVFLHPEHPALWHRAAARTLDSWNALFAEYQSVADTPACLFWRELVRAYPDAKVVLTVRDPKTWYESMCSTVYPVTLAASEGSSAEDRAAHALTRELVYEVSQGWQPLCQFLGVPVPAVPFPKTNERALFRRRAGLER